MNDTIGEVCEDGFDDLLLLVGGTALHWVPEFLQGLEIVPVQEKVLAQAELVVEDVVGGVIRAPDQHHAALDLLPLPRAGNLTLRRHADHFLHGNILAVDDMIAGVGALGKEVFRYLKVRRERGGESVHEAAQGVLSFPVTADQLPVRDAVKVIVQNLVIVIAFRMSLLREPFPAGMAVIPLMTRLCPTLDRTQF